MSFQRTRMSADRTLMSVIRTSLSLISFGFTIFQVFRKLQQANVLAHSVAARNFGIALVLLGIAMQVVGINLRTDPYEFADVTSNTYYDWFMHNAYFIYAAQTAAGMFAETFREFPPVQKPNTFTLDQAMAKMSEASAGGS